VGAPHRSATNRPAHDFPNENNALRSRAGRLADTGKGTPLDENPEHSAWRVRLYRNLKGRARKNGTFATSVTPELAPEGAAVALGRPGGD